MRKRFTSHIEDAEDTRVRLILQRGTRLSDDRNRARTPSARDLLIRKKGARALQGNVGSTIGSGLTHGIDGNGGSTRASLRLLGISKNPAYRTYQPRNMRHPDTSIRYL